MACFTHMDWGGDELWNYDLGASVSSGIAVAGDLVVLGAASPAFAPFIKAEIGSGLSGW